MRGGSARRPSSVPLPAQQTPRPSRPAGTKKSVLFVCIGNSCRSQMAEAFARRYGSDILDVKSAGLAPATIVSPLTKQVLREKNVPSDELFPKPVQIFQSLPFDVVVNLSGMPLPMSAPRVVVWPVTDPIGQKESVYREVADRIEHLVMALILELRSV